MEISASAVADYVDQALAAMTAIVTELGDEMASRRPARPGATAPYAILRHCLGVMDFGGGQVIAGREVQRDRDAEFRAAGPVAELAASARQATQRLRADLAGADPGAPPRGTHPATGPDQLEMTSQGHALLHIMEELYQHLGQLELTRDILTAPAPPAA